MVAHAPSIPPEEVLAPPAKDEDYVAWRATTDLRAPYRVSPEFLQGTKKDAAYDGDDVPLIVFINARSGGRVGPELANVLARALGRSQVFDLAHHRPDTVLQQIWRNFDEQERLGNPRAALVRQRLRILACGGDGTVAWIMKVIQQLNLQPQPAVAIMPLGTGNDLSRTFLWGAEFDWRWIKGHASVYSTLKRVADARIVDLDSWRLRLALPGASYKPHNTYALSQLPQDEHDASSLQLSSAVGDGAASSSVVMEGMFWNYFSVGADAQAAYNFHHLRDQHPMLASNRVANQFWYSAFSCTSGWFCGTLPSVSSFTCIEVLQPGAQAWSELHIPGSIKALVLVNLQSYGGGRNIWGASESRKKSWRTPDVADGLIEVVGFTHGFHALAVMSSDAKLAHGKRLAQVAGIRLALRHALPQHDGGPGSVFMQLDGEPWMQQVPAGSAEGHVMLEVVHAGISKLLVNSEEPSAHPVDKMTDMLSEQQAHAYLTAAPDTPTQELELQQHQWQQPANNTDSPLQQQQRAAMEEEGGAVARARRMGLASCSGADAAPALNAAGSSCSDPGTVGVSNSSSLNRRSLPFESASSSLEVPDRPDEHQPGRIMSLSTPGHMLGMDAPSAVAVIEIESLSSPTLQSFNGAIKTLPRSSSDGKIGTQPGLGVGGLGVGGLGVSAV